MKILLDTNFLVYCAKQKIDYVSEMPAGEIVVLSSVVSELEKLAEKAEKARDKESAKFALSLLKHNKIKIIKTKEKSADKAILEMAEKEDVVATMDKELKEKLKGKTRILSIRKGKRLEIL